ncbi:hypothetical protein H2248_005324 [Termitomyces sp. 'cryptogamus']|nr:hypothetical protein H2248_005324 [Termitomyces sp. 'cryptogamus']
MTFFHRHVRRFLADYSVPMSLVASSAIVYWGTFNVADFNILTMSPASKPATDREWLVRFWKLEAKWVGIALPFGIMLWILFHLNHNISSLMAQSDFPLRKPSGFHWDFFLLGLTTFLSGLLGLPAPNSLTPQAPIHMKSFLVMGYPLKRDDKEDATIKSRTQTPLLFADSMSTGKWLQLSSDEASYEVPVSVIEKRVSNLAQGFLCLVLLTRPFLHVLNLVPRGVIAGLFWYMGAEALLSNRITQRIIYFLRDEELTPGHEPLKRVRSSRILFFLAIQLASIGATFAITRTFAAIGFPVMIALLVILRVFLIPRLPFTPEELVILDQSIASPLTVPR